VNRDYLREKIVEQKIAGSSKLSNVPPRSAITADSPIPFSINKLWFELDDFERRTFQDTGRSNPTALLEVGDATTLKSNGYPPVAMGAVAPFLNNRAKGILSYLDGVKTRLLDQRYRFLFRPGDWSPDLAGSVQRDLDVLLAEWLAHDRPITILDLSGVPPEIMISISGAILKIVYDGLFWSQNLAIGGRQQPLMVVLEEAHSYLRAGQNSISSRTVQTIAKEGRKYGVGLVLVTQRPTELDETVLSQCGTLIALRMTNKGDQSHVAATVQDELYDLVNTLPSLRVGEGLILGEGVRIPSRVRFFKTSYAPRSSDPRVTELWMRDKSDVALYSELMKYWREQKLN